MTTCPNCRQWDIKPSDDFCAFCGGLHTALATEPKEIILIPTMGDQRALTITNNGAKGRNIELVPRKQDENPPPDNFIAVQPSSAAIEPGEKQEFRLELRDPAPPKEWTIKTFGYCVQVDGDDKKSFHLPVTVKTPPFPKVLTPELRFDSSPRADGGEKEKSEGNESNETPAPNQPQRQSVRIQNSGGIPLNITAVTLQGNNHLSIRIKPPYRPIAPGKTLEIPVTFTPPPGESPADFTNCGLKITFKNHEEDIFIPIRGTTIPFHLEPSLQEIDIREALRKESYSYTVTLVNKGSHDVRVTGFTCSQPDWQKIVAPAVPFTLLSGAPHGGSDKEPGEPRDTGTCFKKNITFQVVLFPGDLPQGRHTGTVTVHTEPEDLETEVTVALDVLHPAPCDEYIGIDFGTSNSVVAVWHEGETLVVADKQGKSPLIPSVLVFHGRADNYKIGIEAEKEAAAYPESTVRSIKRVMGYGNERSFFGKHFWPEDLAALIIKKLVEYAERFLFQLNKGRPNPYLDIRKAIVTVPANFYDLQVRGILEACEKAGIDTEETRVKEAVKDLREQMGHDINEGIILDEPTAAALFFLKLFQEEGKLEEEFEKKFKNDETINLLIFDYGGGTLDVSVVQVLELPEHNIGVRALANKGDNRVGGDSIDLAVMKKLLVACAKEFNGFQDSLVQMNYPDLEERRRGEKWSAPVWAEIMGVRAKWKKAAEDLKIALSTSNDREFVMPREGLVYLDDGQLKHIEGTFRKKITRKTLTGWVKGLLEKSKTLMRESLTLSDLEAKDIDYIIHTGRSSLMPQVRDTVRSVFPDLPKKRDILDENHLKVCVAKGAVLYALLRSEVCLEHGVRIVSDGRKLPHSYGIQVNKGFKQVFEPIIQRGATYPVEKVKSYPAQTGRPFVQVRFLQNSGTNNTINKSNQDIREIGLVTLDTRINGKPGYEVAIIIDANRKIEVRADNQEIEIRPVRLEDEERWIG